MARDESVGHADSVEKKVLLDLHNTKQQLDTLLPTLFRLREQSLQPSHSTQQMTDITTALLLETLQLYSRLTTTDDEDRKQSEEVVLSQLNNDVKEHLQKVRTFISHDQVSGEKEQKNAVSAEYMQAVALLENYSRLLSEWIDDMSDRIQVKQIEVNIQLQAEALKENLTEAIDHKEMMLATKSWAYWPIQVMILFTICCAVGIARERVRISQQQAEASELRRREAERQKHVAQHQEEKAKQLHEQNRQSLLLFTQELSRLSEGDLTVHLEESDDVIGSIALMMNHSVQAIRGLVKQVIEMAELVAITTNSLGMHATSVVEVSRQQSAAIRETGGDIQEIAAHMTQISESANASVDVAKQSVLAAERGAKAVENSVQGMHDIRDHIKETSQRIKRLGESSQEIGEVTDLIADIAEQTHVLAMNAFIQAASAGEAGKGFSIVAEEIQRLAERSNDATQQISTLIKMIQVDTHDAIAAMERSTLGVVEGSKLADAAGEALSDIREVSNQMADLIRHFSSSTQSQAILIGRVAATMQNMLELNIRIEEGRERVGENYQKLDGVAQQLKNSVAPFRIT